ncbi:hypothetical protein RvY_02744 [Ramazzottius varieornatus]|uniref:Uncharacterized protein n=1 Tax=Ramazzottius varieornatus TaxID=947166 RepID=A0A1D1UKS7_RAMVA|nr:hypothetical protein RvY_02744 [Ramazzottius varieornatus]
MAKVKIAKGPLSLLTVKRSKLTKNSQHQLVKKKARRSPLLCIVPPLQRFLQKGFFSANRILN